MCVNKVPKMKIVELASSVDPDETAQNELPHLDLHCLLSSLLSFQCDRLYQTFLEILQIKLCHLLFGLFRVDKKYVHFCFLGMYNDLIIFLPKVVPGHLRSH